ASEKNNIEHESCVPEEDQEPQTPAEKLEHPQDRSLDSDGADCGGCPTEDSIPIMKDFLEQLFGVLHEEFAILKQEIAANVKDLKREATELGQKFDTVEHAHDAQKEEIDQHKKEILALQDSNRDL
ncbi:hypothetical protein NDU88_000102, partial [Pleurodeles waltl]